jgi:hypothetical protein
MTDLPPTDPDRQVVPIDLVVVAAKDFAHAAFGKARRSDFRLPNPRFQYADGVIRRVWGRRVDPAVCGAWVANVLIETDGGSLSDEIVEIVATTPEAEIIVEEAFVARILGVPPVLGSFRRVVDRV